MRGLLLLTTIKRDVPLDGIEISCTRAINEYIHHTVWLQAYFADGTSIY